MDMPFERYHIFLFSPIGYERASFHSFSVTNYPNIQINLAIDGMKITFHYCLTLYSVFKIYLAVPCLFCCTGFSLFVENWGYSPVAVHRLLIAMGPIVADHRF